MKIITITLGLVSRPPRFFFFFFFVLQFAFSIIHRNRRAAKNREGLEHLSCERHLVDVGGEGPCSHSVLGFMITIARTPDVEIDSTGKKLLGYDLLHTSL